MIVLNIIQKSWSFIGMEWTVKKIVTRTFNIFSANWIKDVLEVVLKGTVMQTEKTLINDRLRVSKIP